MITSKKQLKGISFRRKEYDLRVDMGMISRLIYISGRNTNHLTFRASKQLLKDLKQIFGDE